MLSDIAWKVIIKELHNDNIHSVSKWGSSDKKKIINVCIEITLLILSTNSLMHASMSCNLIVIFAVFIGIFNKINFKKSIFYLCIQIKNCYALKWLNKLVIQSCPSAENWNCM